MRTAVLQKGPLLAACIALLTLFYFVVPGFLAPGNMLDLMQQIAVNAIIAFGLTFTILIGGIDLPVGAVLAVVGTTTVFMLGMHGDAQGLGWLIISVLIGLSVGAAFGAANGICAAKTKMPAFIITLATMQIARGAAYRFNNAQPMRIPDSQTAFLAVGNGRLFDTIPISVVIMLVVFALATILLHRTRFGQHLYAIGGNREAARFTGIPIAKAEIVVYMICGALAGVAGMINASQLYSAEPASGIGFELDAIAAVVVGGTSFTGGIGGMWGTLIGAIIIGILSKGLNQAGVHFSLQYIVKGLVILSAVYFDVRRRK
jgi:ribose transport system permease protein